MNNTHNNGEDISFRNFEISCPEGNKNVLDTLGYFKGYILSLGKIDNNDVLRSTISLFICSNYDLLWLSFDLLKRGYLRPSIVLLRPAFESIILSMYFIEFPQKSIEYKNTDKKLNWLRENGNNAGMMETIIKNGKIFNTHEHPDFLKNLISLPLSEINKAIHFNNEELMWLSGKPECGELYVGPRNIDDKMTKTIIVHILQAILFSINAISKTIKPFTLPTDNTLNEMIDYLNRTKGEITIVSPNP